MLPCWGYDFNRPHYFPFGNGNYSRSLAPNCPVGGAMIAWIAVWWHCLFKTFALLRGEDHRMCSCTETIYEKRDGRRKVLSETTAFYCACGYGMEE